MTKFYYGWLIFLCSLSWPLFADQSALYEAINLAYQQDPRIHEANAKLKEAKAELSEAGGGYWPTIKGIGEVGTQSNKDPITRDGDKYVIGLEVTQNIYTFGRVSADIERARAKVTMTEYQRLAVVQDVLLETIEAWYQCAHHQQVLTMYQTYQDNLATQWQNMQEQAKSGLMRSTDVFLVRSRLEQAKAKRARAQAELSGAENKLRRLITRFPSDACQPITTDIDLAVVLPDDLEQLILLALTDRPALLANKSAVTMTKAELKQQQAELKPNLALQGRIERGDFGDVSADSEAINLMITIPLYEGGRLRSRVRSAGERLSQEQQRLAQLQAEIKEQITTQWKNWQSQQQAYQFWLESVMAEKQAVTNIEQEVAQNLRPITDVLKAKEDWLQAQIDTATAQVELQLSYFRLLRMLGKLTLTNIPP